MQQKTEGKKKRMRRKGKWKTTLLHYSYFSIALLPSCSVFCCFADLTDIFYLTIYKDHVKKEGNQRWLLLFFFSTWNEIDLYPLLACLLYPSSISGGNMLSIILSIQIEHLLNDTVEWVFQVNFDNVLVNIFLPALYREEEQHTVYLIGFLSSEQRRGGKGNLGNLFR